MDIREYLYNLAVKTVNDCIFEKDTEYMGIKNKKKVFLPAGDEKYVSFWLIDTILASESGLIDAELLKEFIEIYFSCGQNGKETVYLENGLEIPPFALADHINYDGKAVYFPGTYSSGENQGKGDFGFYPPLNNNYLLIKFVWYYLLQTDDYSILDNVYNGLSLRERLKKCFNCSYSVDNKTQMCFGEKEKYVVDWTYCDQVKKSGFFLVPSVMRAEAALIMAQLFGEDCEYYKNIFEILKTNIVKTFFEEETGWFYSASGMGHQHDVWGTAYIVSSGILPYDVEQKACKALKTAYLNGTATCGGYVRHILTNEDFALNTTWEKCDSAYNTYMNGGYWATPTGWFFHALYKCDKNTALKFMNDFIEHTEANKENGAPYEWFYGNKYEGKNYGTSGTMPYIGYMKAIKE